MEFIATVFLLCAFEVGLCALFGWFFMLAVGVIHHEWWPLVPTIGFWWAVLLTFLLRLAFLHLDLKGD